MSDGTASPFIVRKKLDSKTCVFKKEEVYYIAQEWKLTEKNQVREHTCS